jgi:NADPH-dependent ferric siderophore reductase
VGLLDQLTDGAARVVLRRMGVIAVDEIAPGFVRVDLRAPRVSWVPGQKLQVRVRNLDLRTYTPFGWRGDAVSLLVFDHSDGPAAAWIGALGVGDDVRAFGPRRAVRLGSEPTIFVGDETSFALAAGPDINPVAHVYEVTDPVAADTARRSIGLADAVLVPRLPADAHQNELTARVLDAVVAHPDATLVLTGKAQTIRAVRVALKNAARRPAVRVKAHWDPNRSGLD